MKEWVADWEQLRASDPEVADAVAGELDRERNTLRTSVGEGQPLGWSICGALAEASSFASGSTVTLGLFDVLTTFSIISGAFVPLPPLATRPAPSAAA